MCHTLEICALLRAEPSTRLLHPCRKVDLDVLGHSLIRAAHLAIRLALAHHLFDALYAAATLVEAAGDVLCQRLDIVLLGLFCLVVVKSWEHMFLVQPLQLLALGRNAGQQLRHFVRHVHPARREQIHLDHGVAVVHVVGARG